MNIIRVYLVFIGIIILNAGTNNKQDSKYKKIIYTSDIHFSLPNGRWSFIDNKYRHFLQKYSLEENIFFINGDFVDNVPKNSKKEKYYREKEINYFLRTTQKYISKNSKLLLNFGIGHDFGNLKVVESLVKQKSYGRYKWGGCNLVWFTIKKAAFLDSNNVNVQSLDKKTYEFLKKTLSSYKNILLFSHIPLRTPKTFKLGKWSNNRNLTIPLSDKLYSLLDKNKKNILAIFGGHIHKSYISSYQGIPIYSFPFMDNYSSCEIEQMGYYIKITPKNTNIKTQIIYLNFIKAHL